MISQFTGKYAFLSNFYLDEYGKCVENLYQKEKTLNLAERHVIENAPSPAIAKRLGKKVTLREDWEQIKLNVMEALVKEKFSKEPLRTMLLETGSEELIEGNWWGDTYWGVCNGVGENHLGKILMKVRKELNEHIYKT